ncbi:dATP/dGTP diphosphohydrolase domain-containing protein [Mycolicibacterium palauense]|uniref:dATP/dGTP diphosphohydrolase domain-containing protein n=1 Tax=Mycolicibacterium palauense TaxID=2034511 RepID=UPI000BFF002E|nr:dATP/dGTP diphosphohydrolase domain-containing protein [Mycolicibacterium palauense]
MTEGQHPVTPPTSVPGEVRTVSESGGEKGSKLARFDLIPPTVLWELAEHYGRGAEKYEDDNWRRGYDWKYSYAAVQRHLNAFWAGEDIDPETGSKHVVSAAWHCFALAWFMVNKPEYDSRPSARSKGSPEEGRFPDLFHGLIRPN